MIDFLWTNASVLLCNVVSLGWYPALVVLSVVMAVLKLSDKAVNLTLSLAILISSGFVLCLNLCVNLVLLIN